MSEAYDLDELNGLVTRDHQPRPHENTFSQREARLMDREAKVLTTERMQEQERRAIAHGWSDLGREQRKLRSAWINFHFTLWLWLTILILGTFLLIGAGNRHLPHDAGINTPNAITRSR